MKLTGISRFVKTKKKEEEAADELSMPKSFAPCSFFLAFLDIRGSGCGARGQVAAWLELFGALWSFSDGFRGSNWSREARLQPF